MLPAPAGMSPTSAASTAASTGAPRTCGDEPETDHDRLRRQTVLPAPAGMSPSRSRSFTADR